MAVTRKEDRLSKPIPDSPRPRPRTLKRHPARPANPRQGVRRSRGRFKGNRLDGNDDESSETITPGATKRVRDGRSRASFSYSLDAMRSAPVIWIEFRVAISRSPRSISTSRKSFRFDSRFACLRGSLRGRCRGAVGGACRSVAGVGHYRSLRADEFLLWCS